MLSFCIYFDNIVIEYLLIHSIGEFSSFINQFQVLNWSVSENNILSVMKSHYHNPPIENVVFFKEVNLN